MISAQELLDPTTPVLRIIEEQARASQNDGQQFLCLTSIDGYLPVKEKCNTVLVQQGYTLTHGCMFWGDFARRIKEIEALLA